VARLHGIVRRAGRAVAAQRGRLLCWAPVFLALGIGGYLSLRFEPVIWQWGALAAALALLGAAARHVGEDWRPLLGALALVLAGAALAGARAHLVAEPVLGFRYYGPVEGRIVNIDRSGSDALRLTLDRVVLADMAPGRTPARVRVSLHGDAEGFRPEPGAVVIMTAHLAPPAGPVEPGGFDFRRKAWFAGLGGVGYTRTPVLRLRPAGGGGLRMRLLRARHEIAAWVRARMPGARGAFAAAVMTGERSGVPPGVVEDLRRSNLAHLLAISGLHMGLVTGFMFSVARLALALVPGVALRYPARRIAALWALAAGAGYLALSGGNVATERAFVMVAVLYLAVVFERRAITLRAVAVAALVVLVRRPEVLPEPGFQMSFAATVALVTVFESLRGRAWPDGRRPARWMVAVLATVLSSAVAGAATAPFAAAHFNRIAAFGLVANMLAVPVMGLLVMPGAVLTAVLAPLGMGAVGLAVMRPAIGWVLWVAQRIGSIEGAVVPVPTPQPGVLAAIALGGLWLALWRGRAAVRLLGAVPVALALLLWTTVARPEVLVADTGRLLGAMTPAGRALSKPRGDGFSARVWLENDGDAASQKEAAARPGLARARGEVMLRLGGARIVLLTGRKVAQRIGAACARAGRGGVVIVSVKAAAPPACTLYDRTRLQHAGALAIGRAPARRGQAPPALQVVSVHDVSGIRPWSPR